VVDQPADGERLTAVGAHFHGNLVGGAADAAGAHLEARLHIVERVVGHLDRGLARALLDAIERAVDDRLGDRLLSLDHQAVHELVEHHVPEFGIRLDFAMLGSVTTRHSLALAHFGRLAPYFERRWRRSLTLWVSSVPRMTW